MRIKRTTEEFLKLLSDKNSYYKEGLFEIIGEYESLKTKILLKDKFGVCAISTGDLLYNNYKPRIESAVDKTQYFINKSNSYHNYLYDYSKSIYTKDKNNLIITCKTHGDFKQTPNNHYMGKGCPDCKKTALSNYQKSSPTGWSLTNWINKAKNSKNFDSFKVYIIKVFDENEEFYKIGRTFTKLNKRFDYSANIPYNYQIVKIYEDTAEKIFNLENELKRKNKINKYTPLKKFDGMYECFKLIQNELT